MFSETIEKIKKLIVENTLFADKVAYVEDIIANPTLPENYKTFISGEKEWVAYVDLLRIKNSGFYKFNLPDEQVFNEFEVFLKSKAVISKKDLDQRADLAVKIILNYLCRPVNALKFFIFKNNVHTAVKDVFLGLRRFNDFKYLLDGIYLEIYERFVTSQKDLISVYEFMKIVKEVDSKYFLELNSEKAALELKPIFEFFNFPNQVTEHSRIPAKAAVIYFEDKDIPVIAGKIFHDYGDSEISLEQLYLLINSMDEDDADFAIYKQKEAEENIINQTIVNNQDLPISSFAFTFKADALSESEADTFYSDSPEDEYLLPDQNEPILESEVIDEYDNSDFNLTSELEKEFELFNDDEIDKIIDIEIEEEAIEDAPDSADEDIDLEFAELESILQDPAPENESDPENAPEDLDLLSELENEFNSLMSDDTNEESDNIDNISGIIASTESNVEEPESEINELEACPDEIIESTDASIIELEENDELEELEEIKEIEELEEIKEIEELEEIEEIIENEDIYNEAINSDFDDDLLNSILAGTNEPPKKYDIVNEPIVLIPSMENLKEIESLDLVEDSIQLINDKLTATKKQDEFSEVEYFIENFVEFASENENSHIELDLDKDIIESLNEYLNLSNIRIINSDRFSLEFLNKNIELIDSSNDEYFKDLVNEDSIVTFDVEIPENQISEQVLDLDMDLEKLIVSEEIVNPLKKIEDNINLIEENSQEFDNFAHSIVDTKNKVEDFNKSEDVDLDLSKFFDPEDIDFPETGNGGQDNPDEVSELEASDIESEENKSELSDEQVEELYEFNQNIVDSFVKDDDTTGSADDREIWDNMYFVELSNNRKTEK